MPGFRVSGFGFRDPICSVYQRRAQCQPRPKPHSNYSEQITTTSTLSLEPNLTRNEVEHMGGCQNYGPFLGTLNIRGRIIVGIQKGTIILTTNHIENCIKTANISGSGAIRKAAIDVGPQRSCPCAAAMKITVLLCWVAVKELNLNHHAGYI